MTVGSDASGTADAEVAKLREQLRLCRLELAQARREQESVTEQLDEQRRKADSSHERLLQLSRALNDHLMALPGGSSLPAKVGRRVVREQRARSGEWRQVERLRLSPLFQGGWYLRQYPAVAATGLAPAVHYLRHGAAEGNDPGPGFSTRGYLRRHPDVAGTGQNPLLHHLDQQAHGTGTTDDPTP